MLISCSSHQPQKLNIHRRTTYNIPSLGITWVQQHREHRWGQRWSLPCAWEAREMLSEADHPWSNMKTPFPLPQEGLLEAFLWWISAVTVRTEAASNNSSWASWAQGWISELNSSWASWAGFLPPDLTGRWGWTDRLQLSVARALQFAGTVVGVCWLGTLSSKQLPKSKLLSRAVILGHWKPQD